MRSAGKWEKRALLLSLVGLAVLVTACSSLEQAGSQRKLQTQLRSYDHAVRWGDLQGAYAFVKPGGEPLAVPNGLENIRVTDYEPLTTVTEEEGKRVRRQVKIQYVRRDRQVVRTFVDEQVWEYDDKLGNWFRTNAPPEFER